MVIRSHIENLELVCAVFHKLDWPQSQKTLSDIEVALIQKHVFPGYHMGSMWVPQGMCVRCALDIRELDRQNYLEEEGGDDENNPMRRKRNIVLKFPEDYICDLPLQHGVKLEWLAPAYGVS